MKKKVGKQAMKFIKKIVNEKDDMMNCVCE